MLAVLGYLGLKSGSGPSGKAIRKGIRAGKWPKPKREGDPAPNAGLAPNAPNAPNAGLAGLAGLDRIALKPSLYFFKRCI